MPVIRAWDGIAAVVLSLPGERCGRFPVHGATQGRYAEDFVMIESKGLLCLLSVLAAMPLALSSMRVCAGVQGGERSGVAGRRAVRLPFEESPFGFHPAFVPPDVAGGDRWAAARELGIRWHRPVVYAFWFRCQPSERDRTAGTFRWDRLDRSVQDVPAGLNVLWNLSARFATRPRSFLPNDLDAYQRYVAAVVERYDGDGRADAPRGPIIRYWQVENEPNLVRPPPPSETYAELLQVTYRAAKAANPDCRIVIGGVGGWVGTGPGSVLHHFRRFYLPVLERLGGSGFDIFDCHWYGNATGDYRGYERVHREIRRALGANGFERVPIWITEMGTYSGRPRGLPLQTERQQAADLLKRYVFPISLGVEKVFMAFGLIEGFKRDDGYFDHTGIIYDGAGSSDKGRGVRKLGYYTYRLMTEKLEGKRFVATLVDLPEHVYAYRFEPCPSRSQAGPPAAGGGRPVTVIWWDWWHERQLSVKTVKLPSPGPVTITSAITARHGTRKRWRLHPGTDGMIELRLDRDPLFVEPAFGSVSVRGNGSPQSGRAMAR
jgi:hypothetical protein